MQISKNIHGEFVMWRNGYYNRLSKKDVIDILSSWFPNLPKRFIEFIVDNWELGTADKDKISVDFKHRGYQFRVEYFKEKYFVNLYKIGAITKKADIDVNYAGVIDKLIDEFIKITEPPSPYRLWSANYNNGKWIVDYVAVHPKGNIKIEADIPGSYRVTFEPHTHLIPRLHIITKGGYVDSIDRLFDVMRRFYEETKNIGEVTSESQKVTYPEGKVTSTKPKVTSEVTHQRKKVTYMLKWNPNTKRFE